MSHFSKSNRGLLYRIDRHPGRKGGTAVGVRKGIPHNHVNLCPISVKVTGVCRPIRNKEIQLASVYKHPGRTWNDTYITELLSFRHKCILVGSLNAKRQSCNSAVSNPSNKKLLQLFDTNDFEISAPQCPTHHLPTVFHIVDHVRTIEVSEPFEKIYRLGAVSKPSLKLYITQNRH
jgi:hypothetical protein